MKKVLRISLGVILSILLILGILFLTLTGRVKDAPYVTSAYFKESLSRLDSIKKTETAVADSLYAGFSLVSITPGIGNAKDDPATGRFVSVPLAGFGARKGASATGVHDSIFIKAVALKVAQKMMIFVGADLLIMPPHLIDKATSELAAKGISRDQLLFSATHTHSSVGAWGPGFIGEQFAGKANPAIQEWLVNCIVKAVVLSVNDLKKAKLGSGNFDAGALTRNRFTGELGTKNNDFSYLIVEKQSGEKAIIGSFSAHATTQGDKNMEFSADYPGYWERKMEKEYCQLAIFCAGSIGSQSPSSKGKGFESARYIGESLADTMLKKVPAAAFNAKPEMSSATLRLSLPEYHIRLTTGINLSTWLSNKLMPKPENVFIQAIRLGSFVWISTPCDFSGELALQIKERLGAQGCEAVVSSFNGSYIGYIVPSKYFYMDEYEPRIMGWFGPTMSDYAMEMIRYLTGAVTKKSL